MEEKLLVFVVQVRVDGHLDGNIVKAMDDWKWRMQGAYAAKVQVDEVKFKED